MKFRLTFKMPDVLDQLIGKHEFCEFCEEYDSSCDKCVELDESSMLNKTASKEFAEKFIKWSEYITVEFDTEAKTAIAIPVPKERY